jgi:hypothetical protein
MILSQMKGAVGDLLKCQECKNRKPTPPSKSNQSTRRGLLVKEKEP